MKITRFENIQAWQESRTLVMMIYDLVNKNQRFCKDLRLASQIQAASVSIMSNIAEGFSRKCHREFIQFLFVSKSSAANFRVVFMCIDQG
jgi:four helix bundle protein